MNLISPLVVMRTNVRILTVRKCSVALINGAVLKVRLSVMRLYVCNLKRTQDVRFLCAEDHLCPAGAVSWDVLFPKGEALLGATVPRFINRLASAAKTNPN